MGFFCVYEYTLVKCRKRLVDGFYLSQFMHVYLHGGGQSQGRRPLEARRERAVEHTTVKTLAVTLKILKYSIC